MSKKFWVVFFCIIITSFSSLAKADGDFTWFGLKKNNTEIVFSSHSENDECKIQKCHHKKPKNKLKHKHENHHKKCHKNHKFFWWCK